MHPFLAQPRYSSVTAADSIPMQPDRHAVARFSDTLNPNFDQYVLQALLTPFLAHSLASAAAIAGSIRMELLPAEPEVAASARKFDQEHSKTAGSCTADHIVAWADLAADLNSFQMIDGCDHSALNLKHLSFGSRLRFLPRYVPSWMNHGLHYHEQKHSKRDSYLRFELRHSPTHLPQSLPRQQPQHPPFLQNPRPFPPL